MKGSWLGYRNISRRMVCMRIKWEKGLSGGDGTEEPTSLSVTKAACAATPDSRICPVP